MITGNHDISFKVISGTNTGVASAAFRVSVETVVANQASIVSLLDDTGNWTGKLASGDTTNDVSLTLNGSLAFANSEGVVKVYDGATLLGSINIDSTNSSTAWSMTLPPLTTGAHALTAVFSNLAGVAQSATATVFNVTVGASDGILPAASTAGIDNANFTGAGQTLDLTVAAHTQVEQINLGNFGGNTLKLGISDVLQTNTGLFTTGWVFSNSTDAANASSVKQLVVNGDNTNVAQASTVVVNDLGASNTSNWVQSGTATNSGHIYNVYTNYANANAQLLIDQHLNQHVL